MFINEKVFNQEKVKQVLDAINEIDVTDYNIYEKDFADVTIYIWCHHLTYDELIYLQQHSDLILSDYKKNALNVMIDEWNNIINQLNVALSNETISDYLSSLQSSIILNMKTFFGFNINGVTFTEEGKKLYDALEKQIVIIDKQEKESQKEKDLLFQKKDLQVLNMSYWLVC